MPIYEYYCNTCQCSFEYLKLSDKEGDPKCPTCCKNDIKRLMSAGSIRSQGIVKGGGGFEAPACKPSGG